MDSIIEFFSDIILSLVPSNSGYVKMSYYFSKSNEIYASTISNEYNTIRNHQLFTIVITPGRNFPAHISRSCAGTASEFTQFSPEIRNLVIQTVEAKKEKVSRVNIEPIKSGTIIMSPDVSAAVVHEAIGYPIEGDTLHSREFRDSIGSKIASPEVTVVDDPTIEGAFGSHFHDADGTLPTKTTLIEKGILKSCLDHNESAIENKSSSTGNSRSESFHHLPYVRMSNLYLESGTASPTEMINDTQDGVYIVSPSGGNRLYQDRTVDIPIYEGYLIRNGEIGGIIHGYRLIFNFKNLLSSIVAIVNGFSLNLLRPSLCSKNDGIHGKQKVPVTNGGPHLMIENLSI